jgi:uncharacterized protein YhaN
MIMRLKMLSPTRYGRFTDNCRIDFGAVSPSGHDFHIIYGPNEAGKSTLFNALQDLLFGIESRSTYNFLHAYDTMQIDAVVEAGGMTHTLRRLKKNDNSLRDADGQPVSAAVFGNALAGMDRETYRAMFSLDDDTLETGGNSILESKGELGRLLFSAASGLADINSVLLGLQKTSDEIFASGKQKTLLHNLRKQLKDLVDQQKALDTQTSTFERLRTAEKTAWETYTIETERLTTAETRHSFLTRLLQIVPYWRELQGVRATLAEMGDYLTPPEAWFEEAVKLEKEEIALDARLAGFKKDMETLEAENIAVLVDEKILALRTDIDALTELAAAYRKAILDTSLLAEQQMMQGSLQEVLHLLGCRNTPDPHKLLLPASSLVALQAQIKKYDTVAHAKHTAEQEYQDARQAVADQSQVVDPLGQVAEIDMLSIQRDRWQQEVAAWQSDHKAALAGHQQSTTLLAEKRAKLQVLQQQMGDIAHTEAAHQSRQARDTAWQHHEAALKAPSLSQSTLLDSAGIFATTMRRDDLVQQACLDHQHNLVSLHILQQEIAGEAAKLEIYTACLQTLVDRETGLHRQLAAALEAPGKPVSAEEDLSTLLTRLNIRLEQQRTDNARINAAKEKLLDSQQNLARRKQSLDQAMAASTYFQEEWEKQLARCWFGTDTASLPTPAEVTAILETLRTLENVLKEEGSINQRLQQQEREKQTFQHAVAVIAVRLGEDVLADPLACYQEWQARLQKAMADQALQTDRTKQLRDKQGAFQEADRRKQEVTHRRTAMETLLEVQGFSAILKRLAIIEEYRKTQDTARTLEQKITTGLASQAMAEAETLFQQHLPDDEAYNTLQAEHHTLDETIRHARASLQELHTAWKQAERDIAAVGGDDQVARLEETRRTLLLDMQEKAENYLSLKFGIAAAERALSQYRNTHQSAMLHKTTEAFTTITCGKYRTLSTIPDKDQRETLIAHMADGGSKSVEKMSKGTAMQLYLALRIAGYHEFIKNREPLPFVADDILETFDDDRSAETFKLLCDLSKHGQVIYLTHHAHLCAMAREVCGNKVAIHPCGETILTTP